jgi:uncharacterized protein YjiS (DUF1127 family)
METIMRPHAISPRSSAGGALPRRIGRVLQRWWLAYMEWRLMRLTIDLMSRMSDRQLKDLGITRSQIESVARGQRHLHPVLYGRVS